MSLPGVIDSSLKLHIAFHGDMVDRLCLLIVLHFPFVIVINSTCHPLSIFIARVIRFSCSIYFWFYLFSSLFCNNFAFYFRKSLCCEFPLFFVKEAEMDFFFCLCVKNFPFTRFFCTWSFFVRQPNFLFCPHGTVFYFFK